MTVPDKPHLTSGEVVAIWGLPLRRVHQLFDRGILTGHRGSPRRGFGHRRIERASVVALVEGLGMDAASLKLDFELHEITRTE